jgi:tetratricopeptide (TPR) repeat protein
MPDLPDDIHQDVQQLAAAGDRLAEAGQYREARALYEQAWALLPAPAADWEAGLWLLVAIGDTHFLSREFEPARQTFMDAVKLYDEARANPFVRLRLGQSMFELGQLRQASDWLAGAYSLRAWRFEAMIRKPPFIKPQLDRPPWLAEGWYAALLFDHSGGLGNLSLSLRQCPLIALQQTDAVVPGLARPAFHPPGKARSNPALRAGRACC